MGLSVWTKYTADMVSTQRSESMNNELKGYISVKYNILTFFEHFDRLVADKRYEEVRCDFKATQSTPSLKSDLAASYAAERRGPRSLPAPCPAVVTLTRRN